ncbi:methyl-accepting chemotaxis protein [Alteromonas sp. a30]|uniref:methyl-accepting chemotaxis protein n=1 Tax=Alteromonas sp. a30 TaxID=2730917 RepID=UPI002280D7AB|nr:methyl-accepting chemotaxis protein [Alteromonas sp. a30]MCY7295373.1 PAS domain-containing protein [Alteromonas sp. a30]
MVATALIALAFLVNIAIAWSIGANPQMPIYIMVISMIGIVVAVWHSQMSNTGAQQHWKQLTQQIRDIVNRIEIGELQEVKVRAIDSNNEELIQAHRAFSDLIRTVKVSLSESDVLAQDTKHSLLSAQTAVDKANTHLMFADVDYNIVYINSRLRSMLKQHEHTLSQHFTGFSLQNLVGTNIDVFHQDPSHQRQLLSRLTTEYRSEITVGNLTFGLCINPVYDEEGVRTGTIVEWTDLSDRAERKKLIEENLRISTALGSVSTNVMLADADYKIVYLNDSLRNMMRTNVDKFKTIRADFDPEKLEGLCIDIFHKDPSHQRGLLDKLSQSYTTEINLEGLYLQLTANPVIDEKGNRLGTTLEWADISNEKHAEVQAQENVRIRVALNNVTTNVMVADNQNNIVYINQSVLAMLRNAASDLRKDLPHFDPDNLIGKNVDIFHKNPEHQKSLLSRLESTYQAQISVGGRAFNLIANPVKDNRGERLGTVVEWSDITSQINIQEEVERLVKDVSIGHLGSLIDTGNKEGFFLTISEGLNNLSQTINAFIKDISATVKKLSEGELTCKIVNHYQGNFGEVSAALNNTIDKLNDILTSIKRSTDSIRSSNHEISIGNDQLSSRTEKQASNLEETAASLEELTSNVRNTADNASTANKAASSAKQQAQIGESIVSEAVQSMSAITDSSNKIVEIISVIDDIAFQTNLLALNASVEAARAGEQGRGFAVVANEVRNLAQRSAISAKEIKELIDVSSDRVSTGSEQVNKCGESLKDILNHVEELTTLISDIANSTNEQAAGIGQVNQAVAELDDITQQNAALAEEASSASQSSVQQADEMVDIVSFFRTDDDASSHRPVSRPKPIAHSPSSRPAPNEKQVSPSDISASSKGDSDDEWQEF